MDIKILEEPIQAYVKNDINLILFIIHLDHIPCIMPTTIGAVLLISPKLSLTYYDYNVND